MLNGRSLRFRFLLLAALALGLTLTLVGSALVLIFDRHIERRVEQELHHRLIELAGAFSLAEDSSPQLSNPLADPRYEKAYSGAYWQISDGNGPALRSRSLWDQVLSADAAGRGEAGSRAFEQPSPTGGVNYVLEREVAVGPADGLRKFRLAVALDHAEVESLGASFRQDVALALGILGAVLMLTSWLQVRFGLQPLADLQGQMTRVSSGSASRLGGPFPAEVKPLADEINTLLEVQQNYIAKARHRAGNLAHGLKTPLTIIFAEARRIARDGLPEQGESVRAQAELMRLHVERELARARTHGIGNSATGLTDVRRSIDRLVGLIRRAPRSELLNWTVDAPTGLQIAMDADDFGEVLGNLLDNARKWAKSRITVTASLGGGIVTVRIADDGPGMPPELRERLMQRGEQAEPHMEGAGLGLAIVTDVLDEYGQVLSVATGTNRDPQVWFEAPGSMSQVQRRRA